MKIPNKKELRKAIIDGEKLLEDLTNYLKEIHGLGSQDTIYKVKEKQTYEPTEKSGK